MRKLISVSLISFLSFVSAFAQSPEPEADFIIRETPEPFMFSVSTLTPEDFSWSLNYSGSYGDKVAGPFGFDGVAQQFAVKGYLGDRFTMYAHAAFGFAAGENVLSAQQAEILRDFIGGKKGHGFRLGAGLGIGRDFSNVKNALGRITASYASGKLKAGGNLLFEKAFSGNRDAIDVITSFGFQYLLAGRLYGGVEAVGEDLEGFWDEEEAEGGAKLLVGPSLNLVPRNSRFAFSLSGGPVFYATRSTVTAPGAIRELPSESGMTVRAKVVFNLAGS